VKGGIRGEEKRGDPSGRKGETEGERGQGIVCYDGTVGKEESRHGKRTAREKVIVIGGERKGVGDFQLHALRGSHRF